MSSFTQFLIGFAVLSPVMSLTFLFCWRKGNFGYVDAVWSYSVGFLALLYFILGDGNTVTHWVALILTLFWSARLGSHILKRVVREEEDGRYQEMRRAWATNLRSKAFVFFQFQAVAASIMSIAPLVLINSAATFGSIADWIGIGIALIALAGEALADRQLSRFRDNPQNKGTTCRVGLWQYSRHPNYFFEWLYWCSFPLLTLGTSIFWITLISPLILLYLILKVTGIPPTERNALKSRGNDYRNYQSDTNAFFPGPRKRSHKRLNTNLQGNA